MPSTHHGLLIHVVFATKLRYPRLADAWRDELFACIGGTVHEHKAIALASGGIEDHVHWTRGVRPCFLFCELTTPDLRNLSVGNPACDGPTGLTPLRGSAGTRESRHEFSRSHHACRRSAAGANRVWALSWGLHPRLSHGAAPQLGKMEPGIVLGFTPQAVAWRCSAAGENGAGHCPGVYTPGCRMALLRSWGK